MNIKKKCDLFHFKINAYFILLSLILLLFNLKITKMKIKDVMVAKELKCCTPKTKLHNAAKVMREGNCGALPVVDKENRVLGMVTDRDICLSLAEEKVESPSNLNVKKIMSYSVHTVKETDDLAKALQQMRINKIGRLPVVDKEGKLKGIVSLHRLLNEAASNGNSDLGKLNSKKENLMKTIHAVTDRYSLNTLPKEKSPSPAKLKNNKTVFKF